MMLAVAAVAVVVVEVEVVILVECLEVIWTMMMMMVVCDDGDLVYWQPS